MQHALLWRWWGLLLSILALSYSARYLPIEINKALKLLSALLFLWALLAWRRTRVCKALMGLALALCLLAIQQQRLYRPPLSAHHCHAHAYLTQFPHDADPVGKRFPLFLQEHDCPLPQAVTVYAYDYRTTSLRYGQGYSLALTVKTGSRGVQATVREHQESALLPPWYIRWRADLRERLQQKIAPPWQGWLQALLLGDRSALRPAQRQALQRTGTSHLIAISGLHVGMVVLLTMLLLRPILAWFLQNHRFSVQGVALLLSTIVAGIYALLSGAEPPVTRAWLMLMCFTVLWLRTISAQPWQGLALAAVLQILLFPEDLWNAGAWLSYVAVLTLLVSYPLLRGKRLLWQFIGLQSALTLVLLPLVWALFGGISVGAWVVNWVLIPCTGVLMLLGALSLVWEIWVPWLEGLAHGYFGFLNQAALWRWVYFTPAWQPTLWAGACLSAALLVGLSRARHKALYSLALLALAAFDHGRLPRQDLWLAHRYRVGIIFSGADAVLVNSGSKSGRTGRDDAARQLLPYLRRRGVTPKALLVTEKGIAANSAIVTVKSAYPQLPIYRFVALGAFPYPTIDCTATVLWGDCKVMQELLRRQSTSAQER